MPVIMMLLTGEGTGPHHATLQDFKRLRSLGEGGKYKFLLILGRLAVHFSAYKTWTWFLKSYWSIGKIVVVVAYSSSSICSGSKKSAVQPHFSSSHRTYMLDHITAEALKILHISCKCYSVKTSLIMNDNILKHSQILINVIFISCIRIIRDLSRIWGSYGGEYEDGCLLGCSAV
jgi:hypothetical protein